MLVAIAAAVVGASAANHLSAVSPDFREGLVSDERPLSLDPLVGATDPAVRDVGALLYRRLLRLDARAVPVADLASPPAISPDGLHYTLTLGAARWSDGRPIAVADVLATFHWVQSGAYPDPATAAPLKGVHVSGSGDAIAFTLPAARAAFAAELTQVPVLPLGRLGSRVIAVLPHRAAVPMATSGPFVVASSDASGVTLVANPHAARRPRLRRVRIDLYPTFDAAAAAFQHGGDDGVLANDASQRGRLVAAGGVAHTIATFRFVDLLFNERNATLMDPAVRTALATAVDRAALVAGPLRRLAVAQVGAVPAGIAWVTPRPAAPPGSAAGAVATLTADGWVAGADGVRARSGVRLSLRLVVAGVAPLPALARAVAAQLRAVGAEVTVAGMRPARLRQVLVSGTGFDLAVAEWDNGPDPDVSGFWRSTAVPPAGFNVSGGSADPFLDQALDRLATLTDPAARIAAVAAVDTQLAADLPAVFLETPEIAYVVRRGVAVDIAPVGTSASRFADIATWPRS